MVISEMREVEFLRTLRDAVEEDPPTFARMRPPRGISESSCPTRSRPAERTPALSNPGSFRLPVVPKTAHLDRSVSHLHGKLLPK